MADQFYSDKQQLDLGEHLAGLWAHKLFVCLLTASAVFLSAYDYLTTDKHFTSTAIFQISEEKKGGFNLSEEMGALASLAGFSGQSSTSSKALLERMMRREFILAANETLKFTQDPFFNAYDPNSSEAGWKSALKKMLGLQSSKPEENAIIENNIMNSYREFVYAEATAAEAISISVTHKDAQIAAKYANGLMEKTRQIVAIENKNLLEHRLGYLSETLADALQDMEEAQQKFKGFALQNSANAEKIFISGTIKLNELRMKRQRVKEISSVLSVIENLITTKNDNGESYKILQLKYPLVDDVDFRRILGMSETISAWSWPSISTIKAVSVTLKDRMNRLDIDIKNIEENSKIYAKSADDLSKFKRDAKIAEATYTVLIEQVKSQSLAAGFRPETFKVFEYATKSLTPSSPNRNLNLGLGLVIGFFLSCALAILNAHRRGVYYTKATIISDAKARLALRTRFFRKFTRYPISKVASTITKNRISLMDEVEIYLANKKLIYVMNCGGRTTSFGTARLLATQSANSGRNIVLYDKTGQSEKDLQDTTVKDISDLPILELGNNFNLMSVKSKNFPLTSSKFKETIRKLQENYEQVYVCGSNREAILGLMALSEFNPTVVTIASLRKTKKADIKKIKSLHAIDILFYD